MAAQELRRTVDDEVGPECERALVDGRSEGVVDDDDGAGRMPGGSEPLDVEHLEGGVRWRLEVEESHALGDAGLDGGVVARVAEVDVDTDPWQELQEETVGAAIGVAHGHDAIGRSKQGEECVADGCHARREAGRGFPALEYTYLLLEGLNGRVRVATVDVSGLAAQRHLQPLVHV
jgi:hypothetical protein